MPGVREDFSKEETSTDLDRQVTNTGLRGMLDGKDYQSVDIVFLFVVVFVQGATGFTIKSPVTRVHLSYSMLVRNQIDGDGLCGFEKREIEELHREVKKL